MTLKAVLNYFHVVPVVIKNNCLIIRMTMEFKSSKHLNDNKRIMSTKELSKKPLYSKEDKIPNLIASALCVLVHGC